MVNFFLLIFFALVFLFLFAYTFKEKRNKNAVYFSLMCLLNSAVTLCGALLLYVRTKDDLEFALKLLYAFCLLASFLGVLYCYKFCFGRYIAIKPGVGLLLVPALTVFILATNEYHHLIYSQISFSSQGANLAFKFTAGPWYYIFIIYCFAALIFSAAFCFISWKKAGFSFKGHEFWLVLGAAAFLVSAAGSVINGNLFLSGLLPFLLIVASLCFFVALFKADLLEIEDIVRSTTFSSINEGIIVTDVKGRLIDFNDAAKKIFPWAQKQNIGSDIRAFGRGRDIYESDSDNFSIEIANDGEMKYFEVYLKRLKDKERIFGRVYIFSDLTKQRELLAQLSDMAYYDPLTSLLNRREFIKQAQAELSKSKRYGRCMSVIMLDIDDFKHINDTYGHLAGDKVLMSVAAECKKRIRTGDIIGRYGGEEFAIVLSDADAGRAVLVAENIRNRISELSVRFENQIIKVTVSIGISSKTIADGPPALYSLVDSADKALYRAKRSGKNMVQVDGMEITA